MSASVIPVAYSMACEAPCDLGWVMRAEVRLIAAEEAVDLNLAIHRQERVKQVNQSITRY